MNDRKVEGGQDENGGLGIEENTRKDIISIMGPEVNDTEEYKTSMLQKAMKCLVKQNLSGAIEVYEKLVIIFTDDAKIFYNLGNSYISNQQYQKAVDCFTKALDLEPDNKSCEDGLVRINRILKN